MNTKFNLESLKAKFEKSDKPNYAGTYYPFWDMKENESVVVRFLPDLNQKNPLGFLLEKTFHVLNVNGEKKNVPCLSMYGEACPVCKASKDFYNAGDNESGKRYWRKKQYFTQALIIKDPLPASPDSGEKWEGKIGVLPVGYQIYNVIKAAFASDIETLECVPFDFEGGYDFIIKKTGQGKFAGYANGSKFIMKQRSLTGDELSVADQGMIDLSTLLPANPGVEKVQALLSADLCGTTYKEEEFVPAVPAPRKEDMEVSEVDAMLAEIKQRRAAQQGEL